MRVTSIQFQRKGQSKAEALAEVLALIDKSPQSDLLLLPEIWPTGFFCFENYFDDSEPVDGPTVNSLKAKAVGRGCYILMGSFVEREENKLFNSTIMLNPRGEIVAKYRKIHLFGYQSRERELLTAGTEITVISTPWGHAGLSTCYDLRFPELYRKMVDRECRFFLVVSAWPFVRLDAWTLFNRARAHENLAHLISCNCAGTDDGVRYAGHSMIVNPLGQIVAEGDEDECFVSAEIDMNSVDSIRKEFSALHDRVIM
jgi:predicted amidohydrolase